MTRELGALERGLLAAVALIVIAGFVLLRAGRRIDGARHAQRLERAHFNVVLERAEEKARELHERLDVLEAEEPAAPPA